MSPSTSIGRKVVLAEVGLQVMAGQAVAPPSVWSLVFGGEGTWPREQARV